MQLRNAARSLARAECRLPLSATKSGIPNSGESLPAFHGRKMADSQAPSSPSSASPNGVGTIEFQGHRHRLAKPRKRQAPEPSRVPVVRFCVASCRARRKADNRYVLQRFDFVLEFHISIHTSLLSKKFPDSRLLSLTKNGWKSNQLKIC
jgi:hypothetical protein